jgi:hypothetical protein
LQLFLALACIGLFAPKFSLGEEGAWCPGAELNHRHADFQSAVDQPAPRTYGDSDVKSKLGNQGLGRNLSNSHSVDRTIRAARQPRDVDAREIAVYDGRKVVRTIVCRDRQFDAYGPGELYLATFDTPSDAYVAIQSQRPAQIIRVGGVR